MADTQSIIALNIGSQRISMGEFAPTKGGIVMKSYGSTSILADPAAEAARVPQVQLAIKELAKGLKVGSQKAAYSLSGQSVFIRFVKLPPLDDENVDELVRFEAQQNVPFPIDEVIWDWEPLKGGGIETEVVLVAIKSDSLNDLNETVAETGLGTRLVDSSPTALYNALRYNYPDLAETTLLLDIGAKTTNLIYAEGEKFFTRSVNIGGTVLTSAIAKDYNMSFAEAENVKLTSGLVTLQGGHAAQLDESTAALGTVIRNSLNRLTAEIQRTTTLFRTQQGGGAPQRIMLGGGSANLPYLKEFLEEKLNLSVEFFNPMQRISVGKAVNVDSLQAEAHQLGELVGLGLRGAGKAAVNIDLVPDKVQAQRDITRRKPALIAASALLLGGIGAWAGFQAMAAGKVQDYIDGELAEKKSALDGPAAKMTTLLKKEDQTQSLIKAYAGAESDRMQYVDLMNDITNAFTSPQTWITHIEPRTGYSAEPGTDTKAIVDEGFGSASFGKSSYRVKGDDIPKADSILIKGLWRNDQQNVYKGIQALREKSTFLNFKTERKVGKNKMEEVQIADSTLIKELQGAAETGSFAAPFELLIPLKEPIELK